MIAIFPPICFLFVKQWMIRKYGKLICMEVELFSKCYKNNQRKDEIVSDMLQKITLVIFSIKNVTFICQTTNHSKV